MLMDVILSLFYVPSIIRTYLPRSSIILCSSFFLSSSSVLCPRDFPTKNFAWTHFLLHPSHVSSPFEPLMVLWSQFPSFIPRTMLWICPLHICVLLRLCLTYFTISVTTCGKGFKWPSYFYKCYARLELHLYSVLMLHTQWDASHLDYKIIIYIWSLPYIPNYRIAFCLSLGTAACMCV